MINKDENRDVELGKKLIKSLNKLLKKGDWTSSLFLRTARRRLAALRDEAQKLIDQAHAKTTAEKESVAKKELPQGYIRAYIYLYQSQGSNLKLWEDMLKSLAKYSVTRPVYIEETHIREIIRSSTDIDRHAYAVVAIKEEDILKLGKPSVDRHGHELLTLRETAVKIENILEFVHANKTHYNFVNNKLIPKK